MRFAYLILAHDDGDHLIKLINKLSCDRSNTILIHIDKKNNLLYDNVNKIFLGAKNIHFLKKRYSVNWSGFSMVSATLLMLEELTKLNIDYNYVTLLSGQCYPIKSNESIKDYFRKNYGGEFLSSHQIGKYEWRIKKFNFFTERSWNRKFISRILKKILVILQFGYQRSNLKDYKLYMGSSWFSITNHACSYILLFLKNNPSFIDQFKMTACSDEHFFQIILMNSNFANNVTGFNLTYVDFSEGNSSPKILDKSDYEKIVIKNYLFARKFCSGRSDILLREIKILNNDLN